LATPTSSKEAVNEIVLPSQTQGLKMFSVLQPKQTNIPFDVNLFAWSKSRQPQTFGVNNLYVDRSAFIIRRVDRKSTVKYVPQIFVESFAIESLNLLNEGNIFIFLNNNDFAFEVWI
jgi:hypothetical protein